MMHEALAGEWIKFWRNRMAAFWAFQFPPLLALAMGLSGEFLFRLHSGHLTELHAQAALSRQVTNAFSQAASPITQLFCLIAIATLFAAEYQWGTWRLLVTRQPRHTIILAKLCVYCAGCLLCTFGIGAAGLLSALTDRVVEHSTGPLCDGSCWFASARIFEAWMSAVLALLATGGVAAAIAIIFRSTLATILVPLLLGVIQLLIMSTFSSDDIFHPTAALLTLPGQSATVLQFFVAGVHNADGAQIPVASAFLATVSLLGWTVAGFGIAYLWFEKRDLARG